MDYLVRVEDEKGIFKLFFQAEGLKNAYQLYNDVLNIPHSKDYRIKLLNEKLQIIKSNVAIISNREASL